ncbi:hypothetical protein E2542_SST13382 [Spatholobus suberectus]|nr:hypothetical protein E2542_SST13382 [Spatholobus suberectus]
MRFVSSLTSLLQSTLSASMSSMMSATSSDLAWLVATIAIPTTALSPLFYPRFVADHCHKSTTLAVAEHNLSNTQVHHYCLAAPNSTTLALASHNSTTLALALA